MLYKTQWVWPGQRRGWGLLGGGGGWAAGRHVQQCEGVAAAAAGDNASACGNQQESGGLHLRGCPRGWQSWGDC
eukprot:1160974-Pelagomonas_calceolata.AAC.1